MTAPPAFPVRADMTTTDTEAVNAGKYRRYRIIAGSYADDGGPCGVQAIEDENGVMCYVTDAEQVITSLRSQLADANEALTIARDVGSAGRNDEVRELQKQSASFRNAFSIADDEAEHCKAMLLEVEKERDQAMAENGELRKLLEDARHPISQAVTEEMVERALAAAVPLYYEDGMHEAMAIEFLVPGIHKTNNAHAIMRAALIAALGDKPSPMVISPESQAGFDEFLGRCDRAMEH